MGTIGVSGREHARAVNVKVPEKVWSHALKAEFRKHGANPGKQKLSGALFVRGEVVKSVSPHIS